jgi:aspartate racemase
VKTIGLIGGVSWYSSVEYYRIINETVAARLGGFHSAQCIMYSVDFAPIDALERQNNWQDMLPILLTAARSVERGGADFMVICSNTTHKMADQIMEHVHIPLLHIADATVRAIQACGFQKVGLLGTNFTMNGDHIRGRLAKHGLDVITPGPADREIVNRVVYDELCAGQMLPESRAQYVEIIGRLVDAGAQGIILGCTEIGLLIRPEDSPVPVFDTARIHAEAAAEYALAE